MNDLSDDNLFKFFDAVHANQKANRINFSGPYAIIQKIDECFVRIGRNLINPQPFMAAILFLRCQYAYKGAAGMAFAGQVVEAFAMIRSTLEYAGYALVIFEDPKLQDVFMNRHQGDAEMKLQKKHFQVSEVRSTITRFDSKLAELFDTFYQRSIDFGGHPNPHATFSAMKLEEAEGKTEAMAVALSADPTVLAHAMKSVAQAGLAALYMFQHVFKAKFELLGVRAEIDNLKRSAGL